MDGFDGGAGGSDSDGDSDSDFVDFMVQHGCLTRDEAGALRDRARGTRQRIGQMMLREGLVNAKELFALLKMQHLEVDLPLGELAVDAGYIDGHQLDRLLSLQAGTQRHPAELLVDEGHIDASRLLEAMAAYIRSREDHPAQHPAQPPTQHPTAAAKPSRAA